MSKYKSKLLINSIIMPILALSNFLLFTPKVNAAPTSCSPIAGHSSICIDPTTGFGPVVYVYNVNGTLLYATGVNSICITGTGIASPKAYDSAYSVSYGGNLGGNIRAFLVISNDPLGCIQNQTATVAVSQSQMDLIRWHSNSVNTQRATIVL